MKYILTITNADLSIEASRELATEHYKLTLKKLDLPVIVSTDVTTEKYEILVHNVMKGDPGKITLDYASNEDVDSLFN